MDKAIVTFISSADYLITAELMALRLQELNNKIPFICGICEDLKSNISVARLQSYGCEIRWIERICYNNQTQLLFNRSMNTAPKIEIFKFKDIEKILYIDAGMYVNKLLDPFFNYEDGSSIYHLTGALAGCFIINPNNYHYKDIKCWLDHMPYLDSDIIDHLFVAIKSNPAYRFDKMLYGQYGYNDNRLYEKNIWFWRSDVPKPFININHWLYNNPLMEHYKYLYNKLKKGV